MPRVATTLNVKNPKRYGYDVRIDNVLLRSAASPEVPMVIQSSDVEDGQINVKQNAEDFTSNLGRIYSRNNFSAGQGLDTAHRANGKPDDINRFWDSKGVDVFHGDDETSYHTHLLYTTEGQSVSFSSDNNYLVRLDNENLFVCDDQTIYKSTDNGDTWSAESSTNVSYTIRSMVAYGNQIFIVTGDSTNTQIIHYEGGTYTNEALGSTLTGRLDKVFYSKGVLFVSGLDTNGNYYLWHASPVQKNFNNQFTTGSSNLLKTAENEFTAGVDAGAVTLISNNNGTIYSFKNVSGTPQLQGETQIPFERVHALAAAEGIVFFGTQEISRTVGRLYRADLVVADDLYVLGNRQLIKEWIVDGVDTCPHSMFVSRDSVYMGVKEGTNEVNLWRYYLPTGGLARDLQTSGNGLVMGITQSNGKFVVSVASSDIYLETSTYESEGYIIMAAADFYTAEHKQFVGAETSTFTMPSNTSVELYYSTKFEALDNPNDSSFTLALDQATGVGDTEKQIAEISRYIVGKVVLKSDNGLNTPKVKSVQFRALARPELVVAQIPINISDRVERPGRKPIKVKGLGDTLYSALRSKEGDSVTLELFDPEEIIRGVVERISYPINSNVERGSVTQYAIITVRGTRQPTITDVTSTNVFGINALGIMRFGS